MGFIGFLPRFATKSSAGAVNSHTLWLTIPRNDRFRGVRRTFTAKTGKLPSFSFYALRGAENRKEEKFSGKIFLFRYPFRKRPPPPKEKSVFDQFGRFFFGYIGIGKIIYGKNWRGFYF